ncbi:TlpA family protein disulfide reductase [Pollutimonas thiosulfatoxidans]|uniref:Thioredoxin n=1 Tax=Pollutimonas thiosulfatoxidans TaxID=2028345 RepID=A0A410GDB4_9BURK|nr:TlpA disulfide reductase family protein [Pollutimonas thiosulfatoxidans]QAA94283.1 thioredoxin [Pollutimonas thiosulfatoxidans]
MKRRDFLRQAAVLAAGVAALPWPATAAAASALPPHPFYGNAFPDTQGRSVGLDSYLGKPMVLNFWATWCPPCVKEMPDLDALHNKYPSIHFVGLAVDTTKNVLTFQEKVQVSYPLLVAGHGGIKLMRDLGNKQGGLPFTVVFNGNGRITESILGQIKPAELDALLASLA